MKNSDVHFAHYLFQFITARSAFWSRFHLSVAITGK